MSGQTLRAIRIGDFVVGPNASPFVIAEMSGNHRGSIDRALAIVDAAADAGASAIKLQTYTPDTMTIDADGPDFRIDDPRSLWSGRTLYDLYREAATPWEWHEALFARAAERGIVCLSTPFDDTAIALLESLGAPCYKIASFENTDLALLQAVAATGKPVIVSTGMATAAELDESVRVMRAAGCEDLVLLKCTSTYPASPLGSNLATIPHMAELFGCQVGVSDHSLGTGVAVAAVALGATVVEKHLTLSRAQGGVDSAFSLEPSELAELVKECRAAREALGEVSYGPTEAELPSLRLRRSCYAVRDMEAGEAFTRENLRVIRPGFGLAPRYYEILLGKHVNRNIARGEAVTWEMLG
jgi:pseudaminic acid synthase